MSFSDCHVVKCPKMDAGLQAVLQIGICPFHIQELMTLTIDYKSKKHICPFVPGSDVGFRRVRKVLKTPLFTGFCASTCILYWCTQHFVNVAVFTAICSVFRRCSQKNAQPSHASAHFAKCVLQKIEMDCFGTYFTHAQT